MYTIDDTPLNGEALESLVVRMTDVGANWSQRFLLVSDVHFDSPHCDRALLKEHLDEALDTNAGIFCFGDFFDAMQGRDDPRRSKSDLRHNYNSDAYIDDIVRDGVAFLRPYRDNIVALGDGNHETSVRKKLETDLTGRLCEALAVPRFGYSGFVFFLFKRASNGGRSRRTLYFHHGAGAGGGSTQGSNRIMKQASIVPDADILVEGHIHQQWQHAWPRLRTSSQFKVYQDHQLHIRIPGYKCEYDVRGGYPVERGMTPGTQGGCWLEFYHDARRRSVRGNERISFRTQWTE